MILSIKDLILNNYENFILLWIIFAIHIFFWQWNTNFFTNFQRYFVKHLLPKYSLDILPLVYPFTFLKRWWVFVIKPLFPCWCYISDDNDAQNYYTDFLDAKRVNVRDMAVNIAAPPVIYKAYYKHGLISYDVNVNLQLWMTWANYAFLLANH